MKRYIWIIALILLILPSFITLLRPGIHNIQDNMQYFRIYEMQKCFDDKQIPCRWVPDMGYGFGYPLFLYYSPGPYYLGTLFHNIGFQYIDSVKILFIGGFLISGIGMFLLLSSLFSNPKTALIGSLIYVYAPVRAVQVYVRGSLGEFLAMAVFPFLFLFSYRIIKGIGKNNILWLGLAVFSLLVTHNLMSLAFFPILGAWIILLLIQEKKNKKIIDFFWAFLIGIGLASFYIVPLVFERGYIHLESMIGGYFDYRQHFVNLYQLFISNHFGYGSSYLGSGDDLSLSVGQVQWVLGLMAVILAIKNYKKSKKNSIIIFVLAGLSLLTIFLIHQRSSFIWNKFSFMAMFQFPWRFLVISTFLLSLLSSYAINYFKGKWQNIVIVVVGLSLLFLYGSFFRSQKWLNINDQQLLTGQEFLKQQTASIFDYLPKSAILPPNHQAPELPELIEGDVEIFTDYQKGSNWQAGKIIVYSETAIIRLPIFDFPGMEVTDNGFKIEINHDECRGLDYCFGQVSFKLNEGIHQINVKLKSTLPRKIGDLISLVTLVSVPIFMIIKKKKFL
ncbi:MAG: hypothetical protein PHE32_02530 [Candidatus Shapirobacteria bacterium]|nr:hypothetical protein [Candidatus Shapirobacteria bacterium]MDD4410548.1 hypothetical protein [Candidatus Shapirobacteria bacterium]